MCTNPRKLIINKEEVIVPCGKCDTCRRRKSQEWAIKLINESKYHLKSCFITLTFDNKILMDKNSKAHKYGANVSFAWKTDYSMEYFKKFIKRLRKKYADRYISYFHVAEYGERTHRPHHHAIIFGVNFEEDRKEMEISKSGHIQMHSDILESLWACGRTSVQDTNPNNIIYITQYALKKFKKDERKYPTKMTFSNRCKMNVKFIRRHPENIKKGYLEDTDRKKYRIPKSYLNNLKKEENNKYAKIYEEYDQKISEFISNNDNNERLKFMKNKEKILRYRDSNFCKTRDF